MSIQSEGGRERGSELIVFTKYPIPGKTKTRLIPELGPEGAAEFHREIVQKTVRTARAVCGELGGRLIVCFDGAGEQEMAEWLGTDLEYVQQAGDDIGARMRRAMEEVMAGPGGPAVLIGTDIPALRPSHLVEAFAALRDHDIVLGPARDGGYYLIGLSRPVPELFSGVPWSTSAVLAKTLEIAETLNLKVKKIECLDDVDRPEDLKTWKDRKTSSERKGRAE